MKSIFVKIILILVLLILSAAWVQAQPGPQRVVGFYGSWNYWSGFDVNEIPFDKLTHVIICFLNPHASGEISDFSGEEIAHARSFIAAAKAKNVKTLVSVGGATLSSEFSSLVSNASARGNFARNLKIYCQNNGLDGVDIDWEFPQNSADSANLTLLLKEIRAQFGSSLLLAIDLPADAEKGKWFSQSALDICDWYNVMSYDYTGSFPGSIHGQHSAYSHATNSMLYWRGRGIPKDKIVLGVPFYGKNFNQGGSNMDYDKIVATYRPHPDADSVANIYFNGPTTIKRKSAFVTQFGFGGVMIWEISKDSKGGMSLMTAIKDGFAAGVTSVQSPLDSQLEGFSGKHYKPWLSLSGSRSENSIRIDLRGRLFRDAHAKHASWNSLPTGFYFAHPNNPEL